MKFKRVHLFFLLFAIILFFFNKKAFLMSIFIISTLWAKIIRTKYGLDFFVFEPLIFYALIIMKFWGFKELVFFLSFSVIIGDFIASNLTDGSFLNFALFNGVLLVSYALLSNSNLIFYGLFATVLYAILYTPLKIRFLGGNPLQAIIKATTPIGFVFLYLSLFGNILGSFM